MNANREAFLTMIAISEGTEGRGDRGYNVLAGGHTFTDYSKHPNILVELPRRDGPPIKTSAAGRYQFLHGTWEELATKLHLKDFSKTSQDLACIEKINERGALEDVDAGRIADAIAKCHNEWASLPGNNYGQHQNKLDDLIAAYEQCGGSVA